ncbi:YsnF/AvaK domain-containing protein [Macrococcoides caseolyticum]|uniref:YsnF/AvaK domain-containing protein n=1 Tax=Macrococcoides caseolyticum TaxID=69966 RepID=UPI001F1E98BB|nr:YsnF/AvaK domain-containing protein [Macrococcus caseolyticus]
MKMRNLETFLNEESLLRRIDQLKSEGIAEHDLHVISKHKLDGSALDYTDVQFKDAEGSFGDKVAAFFTGEDPQHRVFDKLDLSESERVEYDNAVNSGKILLYVDNDAYYNNTSGVVGNPDTDADYAATHRTNNLNNREDVVDMSNNNYNNSGLSYEEYNKLPKEERLNYLDNDLRERNDISDDEKIQLHEERLRVNKDVVQSGEVTIDKNVVSERQEFDVPVSHDEVTIERRKVNETAADGHFDNNLDEETIRVPLTEERVSIDKENVVSEELLIKKNRVTDTEHVSEEVRREEVEIDDTNAHRRDGLDNDLTDRR